MNIDLTISVFRFVTTSTFMQVLFGLLFLLFSIQLLKRRQVGPRDSQPLFLWWLVISLLQLFLVFADVWIEWHRASCGLACQSFFPPESNFYFNQIIVRWASVLAFNAVVGLIGGLAFLWFAKRTNGRVIDQLDVDLLAVGGMVAGWPNILIFYGLVFVLTIILTLARAALSRSLAIRMIITPVLPVAAAVIAVFGDAISRWLRFYEIGLTVL